MVMREDFATYVKDALTHLYDYIHLQNHPLVEVLGIGDAADTTRAKRLRQMIAEAMEELRPAPTVPFDAREWRGYRILYQRYIEGMGPEEVMRELALSSSHFFREQQKALEAVASLLWDRALTMEAGTEPSAGPDMLQAEAERMAIRSTKEHLALDEVVREVLPLVRGLAASKGVTLQVDLPEPLPPTYMGHAVLRQILLNTLYQVLEWTQEDGIVVTAAERGNYVVVEISAEDPRPEAWPGEEEMGGMAVARQLTESQGGRLDVEAELNAVRICLPVSSRMTVLVVDDNEDAIRLFRRYLSGHGYQVIGAQSCDEALHLASTLSPDVITLDVMMPNRDGWEALQALKTQPDTRPIPVLVCSVLDEPELALSLGAAEHLTKPVTQERLLTALDRCRRSSAGAEATPGCR